MTLADIARYRLINQQLSSTVMKTGVEMVEWLGAMQGQEYAQTKWALGLRLPHLSDKDVEKELDDGKILRTHLLRPTWHFVSSKDIRWLLKLTAPRVHAASAYMYRQVELDSKTFNRCNDIIVKSLVGGKQLTRDELNESLRKNKIIASGHRLSYITMNAELEGIICSGTRRGNQFTYALLDERTRYRNAIDRDEALAQLAHRYFTSRGPATVNDFSTWSGLTVTDCKKGIEIINASLKKETVDRKDYFLNKNVTPPGNLADKIHLLPTYDEFIMGYKDRSAIMPLKSKPYIPYTSLITLKGQVIGSWKRTVSKNEIDLEYTFLAKLTKPQGNLFDQALDRFAVFSGVDVNRREMSTKATKRSHSTVKK